MIDNKKVVVDISGIELVVRGIQQKKKRKKRKKKKGSLVIIE